MIKILVCGATGFIGRNLVNELSKNKNYQIFAVHNKKNKYKTPNACNKVIWYKADLTENQSLPKLLEDKDIVLQAAATTSGVKDIVNNPYLHVTDNAIMNSLLLREAMKQKIKHFIFFSCTVMYKSSKYPLKENDFDENDEIFEKYFGVANTKVYIEKMLDFYSRISEMKTTAIRHSNIFGPYDKFDFEKSHVCGATISKALTAEKELLIWGNGEEKRDLLFIDDLIKFVDKVIKYQTNNFRIYNCGSGNQVSINDLVSNIIKESKKSIKILHDLSKPTIQTNVSLDCNLAKEEINWEPKISLNQGLKKTISWWLGNIDPNTLQLRE